MKGGRWFGPSITPATLTLNPLKRAFCTESRRFPVEPANAFPAILANQGESVNAS
jgi:hypothetical protein